jgi:DNA primase
MIKQEQIEEIRAATDIVDLVGGFLPLKRVGKYYKALCPFHNEKTPSFYVSPDRQMYHCFGCGVGGNAISFLMAFEKLTFPEAVKKLADRAGIRIETTAYAGSLKEKHQPLFDACEFACRFFSHQLTTERGTKILAYARERGLSPATIEKFRLGYAPSDNLLTHEAKRLGLTDELMLRSGLLTKREDGRLREWLWDRLVFPIFNSGGKVIGFGGRALGAERVPKYINSPETEIFKKGENLYGFFQAKEVIRTEGSILVEGYFDLLSLYENGFTNVVAPLGTAFTESQAQVVKRFSNRTTLLFDADPSGTAAMKRALVILLKVGIEPTICLLPEGKDPDLFVHTEGKAALGACLARSLDFIDFLWTFRHPATVEEKAGLSRELMELLQQISDPVRQELYLNKASETLKVPKEVLKKSPKRPVAVSEKSGTQERKLVAAIVQNPELVSLAKEHLPFDSIEDPGLKKVLEFIYSNEPDVQLASLIDQVTDEALKKLLTELAFENVEKLSKKDFPFYQKLLNKEFARKSKGVAEAEKSGNETLSLERLAEAWAIKKKAIKKEHIDE